jgi:hypothetical protein
MADRTVDWYLWILTKDTGVQRKQSASGKQYVNAGILWQTSKFGRNSTAQVCQNSFAVAWESKHLQRHYPGRCVDIGTPDRYRDAQATMANRELGGTSAEGERETV